MNYELVRKLRDMGFKQGVGVYLHNSEVEAYKAYVPTLSELIDACNPDWFLLEFVSGEWSACDHKKEKDERCVYGFKTPKEAVAKLYIKLNEK